MNFAIKTSTQLSPILHGFRKQAGLTQAEVAQRLGISQQSYAAFEARPESASVERLLRVLRQFSVEMMLNEPKPKPDPAVAARKSPADRKARVVTAKSRAKRSPAKTSAKTAAKTSAKITRPATLKTASRKKREIW